MLFDLERYSQEYDSLALPGLTIRRGVEYGLYEDNQDRMHRELKERDYDFVLGSVHFVDDIDVYFAEYWQGKTVFQAQRHYFETMLSCVQANDEFDVLAHMTYLHAENYDALEQALAHFCSEKDEPMLLETTTDITASAEAAKKAVRLAALAGMTASGAE